MKKLIIILKRYWRFDHLNSKVTLMGRLRHIKNRAKRDLYSMFFLIGKSGVRFEGHYTEWRSKRILAILDEYGHRYFDGKTALEVGAGYGDIGAFFRELGCKVTCLEGLASNVRMIKKRHPFVRVEQWDLNKGLPLSHYNIIFHFGTLYHLADPEYALREACRHCDCLILETEVSDSDDPYFTAQVNESLFVLDQALNGVGSRPSPAFVERVLKEEGFVFNTLKDARCNSGSHKYDWVMKNTKSYYHGQRRFWFASRIKG